MAYISSGMKVSSIIIGSTDITSAKAAKLDNMIQSAPIAFGADSTTFDVAGLDCDTYGGGIELQFRMASVANTSAVLSMRINGSESNLTRNGMYSDGSGTPTLYGAADSPRSVYNFQAGVAGAELHLSVSIPSVLSGRPRFGRATLLAKIDHVGGTYRVSDYTFLFLSNDEIASIGVASTVADDLAASSTYTIRRF